MSRKQEVAAAAESGEPKRRKAAEAAEAAEAGGAQQEAQDPLSDTEYEGCSLSDCPEKLTISSSGHSRIDGEYTLLPAPSRGKPCYSMEREGKKTVYLFWYKSGKWHLSYVLGSHKNLARIEERKGSKLPPCEPYTFAWKVIASEDKVGEKGSSGAAEPGAEGKAKAYAVVPAMRVVEGSSHDDVLTAFLDREPEALAREHRHHHRRSRLLSGETRKARRKTALPVAAPESSTGAGASAGPGAGAGASGEGGGVAAPSTEASSGSSAPAAVEALDEEAAAVEAIGDSSDSSSAQGGSASDEDDSDSESASSSTSVFVPPPSTPLSGAAGASDAGDEAAGAKAAAAAAAEAERLKREAFEKKLRHQLGHFKDSKQRQAKLQQVRAMLTDRGREEHLKQMGLMSQEQVTRLLDALDQDFGSKVRQRGARGDAEEKRKKAPMALKSSLKRKSGPARFKAAAPRISWSAAPGGPSQVTVTSFKHMGEQLWFQMPGAWVACDICERSVPQTMGALQGQPSRPSFAQNQFLCSDCMQGGDFFDWKT